MRTRLRSIVLGAASLAAAAARADLDLVVGNGDRVAGTLLPATESETYRFTCPAGAKISVDARSAAPGAGLLVRLVAPGGVDLGSSAGTTVRMRNVATDASGEHRVVVSVADGLVSTDYSVSISWTSPRTAGGTVALAQRGEGTFQFAAAQGTRVKLTLSPARRSKARPSLATIDEPDGTTLHFTGGRRAQFTALGTGVCTATFTNDAESPGDARVFVRLTFPKRTNRRVAATTKEIPPDVEVIAAAIIDRKGGSVRAPDQTGFSLYDAVKVDVPAGALTKPAVVVVATLPSDLAPPHPTKSVRATPPVFIGPAGAQFAPGTAPSVVLLADGRAQVSARSALRVFDESAPGAVAEVHGAAVLASAVWPRVQFPAETLTKFQGWFVEDPTLRPTQIVDDIPQSAGESAPWPPLLLPGTWGDSHVALGGGFAFLGIPLETGGGLVRVFERLGATWVERTPLKAPSQQAKWMFGYDVTWRPDVSLPGGGSLLVAAPCATVGADAWDGAVFEYTLSGGHWTVANTITSPAAATSDVFGIVVATDADRLAVSGGIEESQNGAIWVTGQYSTVQVHLFRRIGSGWTLEQSLPVKPLADPTVSLWPVGLAVASGDVVLGAVPMTGGGYTDVNGVPTWLDGAIGRRSAYVFQKAGSGTFTTSAPTSPTRANVGIGYFLAGEGDLLAAPGSWTGSAIDTMFLFRRSGGNWQQEAYVNVAAERSRISYVTISGGRVVARADSPAGAYVFWRKDGIWDTQWVLDAGAEFPSPQSARAIGRPAFDGSTVAQALEVGDGSAGTRRYAMAFFDLPAE